MMTTAKSNDQSCTSVDAGLCGVSSVSEDGHSGHLRERSASPEPIEEGRTADSVFGHGQRRQVSKESIPNSPSTSISLDEGGPSFLNKSHRLKTQRSPGGSPNTSRSEHAEAHTTTTTQNTQNLESREPFPETEIWVQKAILSLGRSHLVATLTGETR